MQIQKSGYFCLSIIQDRRNAGAGAKLHGDEVKYATGCAECGGAYPFTKGTGLFGFRELILSYRIKVDTWTEQCERNIIPLTFKNSLVKILSLKFSR